MAGLIPYFEQREKQFRDLLTLADTPGFTLHQKIPGHPDTDLTEGYRDTLRSAIEDCERALDYLHDTGAQ
jgi:hypothetical protein